MTARRASQDAPPPPPAEPAVELLDVVGQDDAVVRLQRAMAGTRMPHALLFAGPRGVGRRTTALALARTLLCAQPTEAPNAGRLAGLADDAPVRQACGACAECRMSAAGSHPDLHVVHKELAQYHDDASVRNSVMQDLSIGVIRQFLIAPAMRAPSRGRGKVFIVREAELMSNAAQNALLKTLEEPPPGTTLILLTDRADLLLPTTRSRCAMIRLGPLPRAFVAGRLAAAGVDAAEAEFWAGFTGGSLGRSMDLSAREMYPVKRDLVSKLAGLSPAGDAKLGEALTKQADEIATAAVAEAKRADGSALSKSLAGRQAAAILLDLIASLYRDAMTLATGADRPLVHSDQSAAARALAGRFSPIQLAEILDQMSRFERLLWRNVSAKTLWENVVLTCASAAELAV